jgi:protein TonB
MNTQVATNQRIGFLNLLFRARNKAYGAYHLRVIYPQHIKRTLFFLVLGTMTLIAGFQIVQYYSPKADFSPAPSGDIIMDLGNDILNPPPKEEPAPDKPAPKTDPITSSPDLNQATITNVAPVVVDNPVITDFHDMQSLLDSDKAIGANDKEGNTPSGISLNTTGNTGSGTGSSEGEFTVSPEIMPEFIGGEDALIRFLNKKIIYPKYEIEQGIVGTVIVEFVVDKDGSINDAKIIKGVTAGMNQEALRVVKMMPRWNPGMQGGEPVKVLFNVPITFQLD